MNVQLEWFKINVLKNIFYRFVLKLDY